MFAQFGDILFENQYSPTGIDGNENADWVEHALINTKPILQHTGDALKRLNISVTLRQDFCTVKTEFEKFRNYKINGTPNPLLMGDGTVMGTFVIKDMQTTYQYMDPVTGALVHLDLQLSLLEFYVRDPLKQQQKSTDTVAVKGTEKKVLKKSGRSNPTPCNTAIAKLIQYIKNNLGWIRSYSMGLQTNTNRALSCCNTALSDTSSILAGTKSSDYSCVYGNTDIATAATSLIAVLEELSSVLQKRVYYPMTTLTDVSIKYNACVTPARNLETACQTNIKTAITRGG